MPSFRLCDSTPRPALIFLAVIILAAATACSNDASGTSVTGEITDVVARSITEFESLTVIDGEGTTWEFTGGLFSGFTPSHLREHMALGDSVKVWFKKEGDGTLRVTRIEDG